MVHFCYVDEGVVTGSRFGNYLRQYRSLFLALRKFQVVYVAASDRLFQVSERAFRHFVSDLERSASGVATDPQLTHLLEYFQARKLYEAKELESFDRAKLIQLRNERQEFSGLKYDALYERWRSEGDGAIVGNSQRRPADRRAVCGTFSTHLLERDYNLFGTSPRVSKGLSRAAGADDLA